MPGMRSRMNQSNREEVVSSDLNRIGKLAAREAQDADAARATRADFYDPSSNTFDDFSTAAKTAQAVPISGLTKVPSLQGIASSFDMNLGAGELEAYVAGTPAADESIFQVARWPAQQLAWPVGGRPDPTNPRICLICVTPADSFTDLGSRNILVDPNTRETTPQNVYKTANPLATVQVVYGTAAAVPLPPAVPSSTTAIFEVVVPAAAGDSTTFYPVRRSWRKIEFPGSTQHGIVKGCVPIVPVDIIGGGVGGGPGIPVGTHRIVIDGELLTFDNADYTLASVDDTVTPPGTAPSGNDKPTYLYLCGGRNGPSRSLTGQNGHSPYGTYVPVTLVESSTPPDIRGYPSASLGIAAGPISFTRAACCYIGLRFRKANTVNIVPTVYDGDWIRADQTVVTGLLPVRGFKQAAVSGAVSGQAFTLATLPEISTVVELQAGALADSTAAAVVVADASDNAIMVVHPAATGIVTVESSIVPTTKSLKVSVPASTTLLLLASAYNMNIPRLGR
jgi:hypothetical protein